MNEKMSKNILRLLELINIFNQCDGCLEENFKVFASEDEPIETIEELIEAMESEMSYWEPEGEGEA